MERLLADFQLVTLTPLGVKKDSLPLRLFLHALKERLQNFRLLPLKILWTMK